MTWRKAICYDFNSYLIHDIKRDIELKANSFIFPNFPGNNSSIVGCTYNIPYARQIMQSMGYGYTNDIPWDIGAQIGDNFTPGADKTLWKAAEFILTIVNFTDNKWNFNMKNIISHSIELLSGRFLHDMDLIGIKFVFHSYLWDEWPIPIVFMRKFISLGLA